MKNRKKGVYPIRMLGVFSTLLLLFSSGCATTTPVDVNVNVANENVTQQMFATNYEEYLQNTLSDKSFTDKISVKYDITSETLPNYQLHTSVEIKALKDQSLSAVTKQHSENENSTSDLEVTRINNQGITYSKYHEEVKDSTETPNQDRLVKFEESLSEAYDAALPYSSLYDIESAKFSSLTWDPTSTNTVSGVYNLEYDKDYIASLIKSDIETPLYNYLKDGNIVTDKALVTLVVNNSKIESIDVFIDGTYSNDKDTYNFIITMSRSYSDIGKTHPESVPIAEEPFYTEIDRTKTMAE